MRKKEWCKYKVENNAWHYKWHACNSHARVAWMWVGFFPLACKSGKNLPKSGHWIHSLMNRAFWELEVVFQQRNCIKMKIIIFSNRSWQAPRWILLVRHYHSSPTNPASRTLAHWMSYLCIWFVDHWRQEAFWITYCTIVSFVENFVATSKFRRWLFFYQTRYVQILHSPT